MNKLPYTNFDIPTNHLGPTGHYVPPKLRRRDEIDRLHNLPAGTLMLERQAKGTRIAHIILQNLDNPSDLAYAGIHIAIAAENSAYYGFNKPHVPISGPAPVMRNIVKLPCLASVEDENWRETPSGLLKKAMERLALAIPLAESVVAASVNGSGSLARRETVYSRHIGTTGLAIGLADYIPRTATVFDAQAIARDRALEIRRLSQTHTIDGTYLSIGQLADPDSPLGRNWRQESPQGAYTAYTTALEQVLAA